MESKITKLFKWKENPFTFKILPELFVGYNNEVSKILHSLHNGSKLSLLLGPTGSGKTTLLKHLTNKFDDYDYILYIPKSPKDPEDWVRIFSRIKKPGFFSSLFSRKSVVNLYELSEYMNNMLGNEKCLVFIDECHEASLDSLEWLRTLIDQIENLSVLLAGLPVFEIMLKENLETFAKRVSTKAELTNLNKVETRELIKKRIESVDGDDIRPFTQNTIEFIYERTGGFPREIIRMCNDFVQEALDKNISTIDLDFLKETTSPEPRISMETVHELPERQRLILDTLSRRGEATPSEIISSLKIEDYKNKDNAIRSVNNLLRRLMADKLVERRRIGKAYKYKVSGKFQTLMVNA